MPVSVFQALEKHFAKLDAKSGPYQAVKFEDKAEEISLVISCEGITVQNGWYLLPLAHPGVSCSSVVNVPICIKCKYFMLFGLGNLLFVCQAGYNTEINIMELHMMFLIIIVTASCECYLLMLHDNPSRSQRSKLITINVINGSLAAKFELSGPRQMRGQEKG